MVGGILAVHLRSLKASASMALGGLESFWADLPPSLPQLLCISIFFYCISTHLHYLGALSVPLASLTAV